jgi:hypothetical protein
MLSLRKVKRFVHENGYRFELKELSRVDNEVTYCTYVSKRIDGFTEFSSFVSTILGHRRQNAENTVMAHLESFVKLYGLVKDFSPNGVFYLQEDLPTYYKYDGYFRYILGGEFDRYVDVVKDMTKFIMYFGQQQFMELMK